MPQIDPSLDHPDDDDDDDDDEFLPVSTLLSVLQSQREKLLGAAV